MMTEQYLNNLNVPTAKVDVVIDTDTYNEIDDQFAISYLLASSDKLNLKALYAAPFFNRHSKSPKDGMQKSYEEILRLLQLAGRPELAAVTYRGSESYLANETVPVISAAAENLAERAMQYSPQRPLYVVAIGAITNVASALLLKPEIAERMVLVWLGGNGREASDNKEFNLHQDVAAARVVFRSSMPVVQLPVAGVVSSFAIPNVELEYFLQGKNPLCDYLVDRAKEEMEFYSKEHTAKSRVLCDVTAVAWLLNDNSRFMAARLDFRPIPEYDGFCAYDRSRFIQYVYCINRDALATDLFAKLAGYQQKCIQ